MIRASTCTFLLLALTPLSAQQRESLGWPAGSTSKQRFARDEKDLWNLGWLGAKAWDADAALPEARASGRRTVASSDKPANDDGPTRLRILALLPDGPAAKAGLQLQDVVVGIGGRKFDGGHREQLAKALQKALTARRGGEVSLDVLREGKKVKVDVAPPRKWGKDDADPFDKGRERALDGALAWLAERQLSTGGFEETLGGSNGAVVMTSLAGLAWIAGGSSLKRGAHKKNLQQAVDFVVANTGKRSGLLGGDGANWDQTTWAFAHAGIFLGELHKASPKKELADELQKIATELCARQEASGGYAHGPGGKNALGYLELNIMAGFVLSALGLAEQAGAEVDEAVAEKLLAYCEKSSSGGGVGYSTADGQQGHGNIGRTAGAWLGARTLGIRQAFVKSMASFCKSNVDKALDGHASLMQHILLAGLAATAHGRGVQKTYDDAMAIDLLLARAPDGSLQSRPWHESISMSSNTDVTCGEVWTTACWAIVIGARGDGKQGGLPGWTGEAK